MQGNSLLAMPSLSSARTGVPLRILRFFGSADKVCFSSSFLSMNHREDLSETRDVTQFIYGPAKLYLLAGLFKIVGATTLEGPGVRPMNKTDLVVVLRR